MEINELIQIFLYELQEEATEFYSNLQTLEEGFKNGDDDLEHYINDMFVSIHTIKGSASTLHNSLRKQQHLLSAPLQAIAKITHEFEDYIVYLRDKKELLLQADLDLLFEFDEILTHLQDSIRNQDNILPKDEIAAFLKKIEPKEIDVSNTKDEGDKITAFNRHFFTLKLSCEDEYKHGYLSLIYRDILDKYNDSYFIPTKEDLLKGNKFTSISIQVNSPDEASSISDFIKNMPNVKEISLIPYENGIPEPLPTVQPMDTEEEFPHLNESTKPLKQPLRVDASRIDNVLKYTSQLVILGNKFDEFLNQSNFLAGTKKRKELEAIFDDINTNIEFLQSSVLEIRMTPFEHLFSRFPRDVRALSNKYKKPINFKTYGHSTEIDKAILDELSEPFIHLIRNSIIHGIEHPDERIRKGKSKDGNITVHAKHDKNRVIITIADDGQGMDIASLKKSALEKNFVTEEQLSTLSDAEVLPLIFKPGVSSTKEVDEYSGRGMGMEAVRKKIDEINGTITIDSTKEIGTTVTLTLPLTTAIIEGMITRIDNEFFTFPITQVEEVTSINTEEIKTSSGQDYIFLNDKEIPLIHSTAFFDFDTPSTEKIKPPFTKVMILNSQNELVGFTIDEYLGQQSIVVKNLHPFIQYASGISNCHILGDGSISLIVDANDLIEYINKASD